MFTLIHTILCQYQKMVNSKKESEILTRTVKQSSDSKTQNSFRDVKRLLNILLRRLGEDFIADDWTQFNVIPGTNVPLMNLDASLIQN